MSVINLQPQSNVRPMSNLRPGAATSAELLRALDGLSTVTIQQQMEDDIKAGCGAGNTYHVLNEKKEKLFYVVEDANCFCRWMCGPARMTHLTIFNAQHDPALHLDRACCRCDWCCCFGCCLCQHQLVVSDHNYQVIGSIKEKFHCFNLRLEIEDEDQDVLFGIQGPCCPCRCCAEMNFDITNKKGNRATGYIFKQWEEHENSEKVNMDHEHSVMHFPHDTNLKHKALLLGAAFLVELMYMEMS